MHPEWLSNAYLVADEPGGTAVFVDSGAPLEPLLDVVERERLTVTHLLVTHSHHDHVAGNDELERRLGIPIATRALETGGLRVDALPTPGHAADHVAFVVNDEVCFSVDVLFRGSVGGTRDAFEQLKTSVLRLLDLPPQTRVLPGHTDETTVERELEENPFVRVWRGLDSEGEERCRVGSEEARVIVWARDYDGGGKAWVRFADGRDAIVGGSRVQRG